MIGMIQHVLASIGEVRPVEEIVEALKRNLQVHKLDDRGMKNQKGSPSYGRWRNTDLEVDYDALGAGVKETLITYGYGLE